MSKTVAILGTVVVVAMLGCLTLLIGLGKDPSVIVTFLTGTLVPSAIALFGAQKAQDAAKAAKQTEHNTNGRMRQIIDKLPDVPEGYEDIYPEKQAE